MKRIVHIPIEPFEERYSADWLRWYKREVDLRKIDEAFYLSNRIYETITNGAFLDVIGTCLYKSDQMVKILKWIEGEKSHRNWEDVTFFFHDLWNPEVIHLLYIRDALKLPFKITGMLHAGTYDPHDFLAKAGMAYWGRYVEHGMWKEVDAIFVATEFHKNLLCAEREIPPYQVHVTGFPIYPEYGSDSFDNPKDIDIVFPHRLDEEKNPHMVGELNLRFLESGIDLVCWKTKECTNTKRTYHQMLHRAKMSISFADQETWGIAMQESVFAGCLPLVPNRLSYSEMYLEPFLYNPTDDITQICHGMIEHRQEFRDVWLEQYNILKVAGEAAIARQKAIMLSL